MPEQQPEKNEIGRSSPADSMASLESRIAAAEQQGLSKMFNSPNVAAPEEANPIALKEPGQSQSVPEPKKSPLENGIPKDNLSKFRNSDGTVDPRKIEESNEHLERGIENKTEKLIKMNQQLMKQFTTVSQKVAEKEKSFSDIDVLNLNDDTKKRLLEEIDKEPVEGIIKLVKRAFQQEAAGMNSRVSQIEGETMETRRFAELDSLVNDGHDWLLEENGLAMVQKTLEDRPYLLQSKTPYRDAVRLMDIPQNGKVSRTNAQFGAKTPVLGASQTIPPPSSTPPRTIDQDLQDMSEQLNNALAERDYKLASQIEAQMEKVFKGQFKNR